MTNAYDTYSISFIVPALNEERLLEAFIEQVIRVMRGRPIDCEIILVNDGSSDSTGAIMDRLAGQHNMVRVLHNEHNMGWGASYQRGLNAAQFDYVMLLCGDGGLPAHSLLPILEQVGKADIVVPYMTNLFRIKSLGRFLLSRCYTALVNLLFGLRLNYYNGLAVHRRDLLRSISITSSGFGFQAEILVKLLKSGCTYLQVGVQGAEEKRQSFALRPRNLLSVTRTMVHLIRELFRFTPIPQKDILNGRRQHNAMDDDFIRRR